MGKEKRKSRLDKGGVAAGGDFVGFSAFAAPSSSLKASPCYTGSDSQVSLVFKRITQKRDAITKARALNELEAYFQQQDVNKKDQVDALSHLVFVYNSKISYDDSSSVRAAAISCMNAARIRLPKAWNTLVTEQQPQVSGEMWCGRVDPAAEVRVTAALYKDASEKGVIEYVTRILGYDRPRTMHDALFARKQETDPPDRDEMEERYERIVGSALGGIDLWIQGNPETEDHTYQESIKDGILWSALNSSKSSLRRKTYSLLTTLCQYAKSIVYGAVGMSALPKLLTNALTQEKDAVNIPLLLEVWLLYLNNFLDGDPWNHVDASLFVKGIGKQLKKACHGASASQWGPTMLPLMATISDDSYALQLQLLHNMSTGMDAAIGPADSILIAAAIAECSSFFLLRRESETSHMDADEAKQFSDYWLQILKQYLASETTTSMAKAADESLLETLSDSFQKLDDSSCNRPHSAVHRIQDWFWDDAIQSIVLESSGPIAEDRWADLLKHVTKKGQQGNSGEKSRAFTVVRKRFQATLSKCQDTSRVAPSIQSYDLMVASVRYCGARYIFGLGGGDGNTTLEHFLSNDLLRWVVLDSSSLSSEMGQATRIKFDFTLLRDCLLALPSPMKQKSMWETILRETVAAKCDLGLLSDGLVVLAREPETLQIVKCEVLDDFAIEVGAETTQKYHDHYLSDFVEESDELAYNEDARKTSLFLQTCAGLAAGVLTPLISKRVVHTWTEQAAPESGEVFELGGDDEIRNPLATTLLSLLSRGDVSLLSADDASRILLESWRRGGKQWSEDAVPLLLNQDVDSDRQHLCSFELIAQRATNELQDLLAFFCRSSDNNLAHVALICHVWSERAYRILQLCKEVAASSGADSSVPLPSLATIGLANDDLWKDTSTGEASVDHLYLCLVYVLQQYENVEDRLDLLLRSTDSHARLLIGVLLSISDASNGVVVDPVTRRDHACAFVLSLLGGKKIPGNIRMSWWNELIAVLSDALQSGSQDTGNLVTRGVSVLSELLFTMFGRLVVDDRLDASTADVVDANDVREGDSLWYLADEDSPRVKAHVLKVHSDDFPRLYFTVRVEQSDDTEKERQTVAERLRRLPESPVMCGDAVITAPLSESERTERVKFGEMIFDKLIKLILVLPLGDRGAARLDGASECMNVIISHCGLLGKEGLGTTRFAVFTLLSTIQSSVAGELSLEGENSNVTLSLRALSLSMGLGNVIPASRNNFKLMKFQPDDSIRVFVDYYNNDDIVIGETNELDRTALEWLTVAVGAIRDESLRVDAVHLVYKLAAAVLGNESPTNVENLADSILVMRALRNAVAISLPSQNSMEGEVSVDEQDEEEIMTKLVKKFACDWESAAESVYQYEILDENKRTSFRLPEWYAPFQALVKTLLEQQRDVVAIAGKKNCDDLVSNLFDYDKRHLAFHLLVASADKESLRLDFHVGAETQLRLDTWQEGLIEEEAEELEDDVGLVGQWVPEAMMNEIESWGENDELDNSDAAAMGRMLCWLSFLSFVDSAAAVDVTFRGSVSAYLSYVDVDTVISTAFSFLNLQKDRNQKQKSLITMREILAERSSMELSKIAGLVVLRTVQVFPTVFKHWWENDCPKNDSAAVSQFVEAMIAPEALRRELARINKSDMGELTVTGSTVSREVTATYTQDECQLSVAIQLPPNFPLRNVEVDGRRTLGVPEKRWKRWALQIRQMLNNQDGTLLDALMLWKENVDKDFQGLEPCPVCYSILSVKTHELPNLQCNTCSNCFHSSCLYKWFHSSGKSSCVLCQQPWSGTRIQRGG